MFNKWVGPGFTVVLLLLAVSGCGTKDMGMGISYTADWSTVQVSQGTFVTTSARQTTSEKEYKSHCRHVSHKDFENNASAHKGEDVYFKGWVTVAGSPSFVMSSENPVVADDVGVSAIVFGVGPVTNSQSENAVIVLWPGPLPSSVPSSLVNDSGAEVYVEVWGESQGAHGDAPESRPKNPLVHARYLTCYTK